MAADEIQGFIGIADGNIEMLFIAPHSFGNDIGSLLTQYAINYLKADKVDVNEQNPAALSFIKS